MSATTWNLDATHSTVDFSVKHMMFTTVRGRFSEVEGTITFDPSSPGSASVQVSIPTASIDTGVTDRDGHLRSADFFDVESHPAITFQSTRMEGKPAKDGDAFKVVGDLTIRGVTREVVLDARFEGTGKDPWGNTRSGFSATTAIDRREFGLTWNQALEAGGVLVGTEVKIELHVQAVAAAEATVA